MELFFCPELINGISILSEEESYHCVKVLRHTDNDEINLIDGAGNFYMAKITSAHKSHCGFEILKKWPEEIISGSKIHLAIAPTKNIERIEWLLEKAVEIGVNEISFLECEHSERRKINMERINRIGVSAMKQSERATLPKINDLKRFNIFIHENSKVKSQKLICHLGENKTQLSAIYAKDTDVIVLIGPEGDFSNEELNDAAEEGFKKVILGANRLRTETAALVAIVQLNLLNQ